MLDTRTLIAELSHEALHRMADEYLLISRELEAAAQSKAAALFRENESQTRRRFLETIPDLVAGYQAAGMTPEAAIRAAAVAAGIEAETVRAWLRHHRRQVDQGQREATKARVVALAEQQLSIREIAAKLHLPRSTVGRLVKGQGPSESGPEGSADAKTATAPCWPTVPGGPGTTGGAPDIRAWAAE